MPPSTSRVHRIAGKGRQSHGVDHWRCVLASRQIATGILGAVAISAPYMPQSTSKTNQCSVDGEIVLTKSKFVLCEMFAQCNLKESPPIEFALWGDALRVKRFLDFDAGQADVQFTGQFQPRCPRLQTSDVRTQRAHMERSFRPFS